MKKLAQKLHEPVIKKYKKRKVNWRFKDNIWAADLAEMDHCLQRIKVLIIYYPS